MITADLSGKRAIVTGGASGIGLGTVELFAKLGATVAINDVPKNPNLEKEVARLKAAGFNVIAAPGDIGDSTSARAMVKTAAEAMGGLDYLINNAGTAGTKTPLAPSNLDYQTDEFWQRIFSVNLFGAFRCTHAAVPYLKASKGAVVNTASIAGYQSGGGSSMAYAASKAALIKLTKDLARGLGPEVRVNGIAPGIVESNWECRFPESEATAGPPKDVALRRIGLPADFAEVILFLCAGAAYVTGQTIRVDGGYK